MRFLITFSLLLTTLTTVSFAVGFKVEKGDVLTISLKGVPHEEQAQINGNYPISKKGELFLPYLVDVPILIEGLSSVSIARTIEKAYKVAGIYTQPKITITKLIARGCECGKCGKRDKGCMAIKNFLTVSGQVGRPGPQPYRAGLRLFDVVSAAEPTKFAAQNRVELLRSGKVYKYNMKKVTHQSVKVYPSDQITLKEKIIRYK